MAYPLAIKKSVEALCNELIKYHPEVFDNKYDNNGYLSEKGHDFVERLEMGLYIELIKAGVIKNGYGKFN